MKSPSYHRLIGVLPLGASAVRAPRLLVEQVGPWHAPLRRPRGAAVAVADGERDVEPACDG